MNFATDRNALIKLYGGPKLASPTCQILPPKFPGYKPYCPYTLHPGTKWTAPDMAKALALVEGVRHEGRSGQGQHRHEHGRQGARRVLRRAAEPARLQGDAAGTLAGHPVPVHPELEEQGAVRVLGLVPGLPGRVGLPQHPARLRVVPSEQQLEPEHRRVLQRGHPEADGSGTEGRDHRSGRRRTRSGRRSTTRSSTRRRGCRCSTPSCIDFVSSRVTNYLFSPQWYFLLDEA